jgi:hypothetical protein
MPTPHRRHLLRLAAALLAAVPVAFGLVRAVQTGIDVRYLWLAGAALLGSLAVMEVGRSAAGPRRVSPLRALVAVIVGAACAGATALFLGAKPGPGVAIVALGFGLCTGASAALAALSCES